ncbi:MULTISPECIES: hypothetical protein [Pseudofrankia]|uniref:hypothetical protein n=1 Tax=Pseudofrankia TaxID=2994363 RepID=UPI000234B577|nr:MULTISPECIES: hypothetical protein [Pseudofrankia]OHV35179.1 hypothetical protein BCD49_04150 [Pseudofrankia sp. EUN1h]
MSTGGRDADPADLDTSGVEARLRAVRAELPKLSVGPWFAQSVRARALRRRARVRAAGSVVVAVMAVVLVVVSVSLLGGGTGTGGIVPARTVAPAGPTTDFYYGGPAVTWPPTQKQADPLDPQTAEKVRAAFRTVYQAQHPQVSDQVWAAAVQDPAALLPVRDKVGQRFPGLYTTISVTFGGLEQVGPATVSVSFTLTFTDSTVVGSSETGERSYGTTGTAVLVDGHWLVSRDTYCATTGALMVADLQCP